jgi:hypothetical protein
MRILKLISIAAIAVFIYELFQELRREPRASREDLHRALNEDQGRMNVTGAGRGREIETEDPDGAHSHRLVGRGVLR